MASLLKESRSAPSTFATLLRSSKFASYDPQISQIYTTYGGHAYRGNWGLKRPLSVKRRNGGFIVIKSIDSKERQTEWYGAEQEARWLNVISDLGKNIDVREDAGSWFQHLGECLHITHDSDYNLDSRMHSQYGPNISKNKKSFNWVSTDLNHIRSAQIPNPTAMNTKEFRRFLAALHRSRPHFKTFVNSKIEQKNNSKRSNIRHHNFVPLNQFNASEPRFNLIYRFLKQETSHPFLNSGSKKLLPSPHHNAALLYSYTSDITSRILHAPVPGRIFSGVGYKESSKEFPVFTVGVAGLLGKLYKNDGLERQATKMTDQEGHATPVLFRAKHLMLWHAPRVVNAPGGSSGIKASHLQLTLVEDDKLRSGLTNPYLPGSQAYIAHSDPSAHSPKGISQFMTSQSQLKRRNKHQKSNSPKEIQTQQLGKVDQMLLNCAQTSASNVGLDD
jgi:Mitochondrial ribosomal protein subunit